MYLVSEVPFCFYLSLTCETRKQNRTHLFHTFGLCLTLSILSLPPSLRNHKSKSIPRFTGPWLCSQHEHECRSILSIVYIIELLLGLYLLLPPQLSAAVGYLPPLTRAFAGAKSYPFMSPLLRFLKVLLASCSSSIRGSRAQPSSLLLASSFCVAAACAPLRVAHAATTMPITSDGQLRSAAAHWLPSPDLSRALRQHLSPRFLLMFCARGSPLLPLARVAECYNRACSGYSCSAFY